MKPSVHFQQNFWNRLKAKGFGGTSLSVVGKCRIKIFRGQGAGVVTPSKPSPPMNNFCLYPRPVLRCFWKDPLMTPTPHHFTSSIFHCYPFPFHRPSPLKNFNHTPKYHPPPPPPGFNSRSMMTTAGLVTFSRNPLMHAYIE